MKKRIFRGIFGVAILVWIACLVLILGVLYNRYSDQYQVQLKDEAYMVSRGIETSGTDYLKGLKLEENNRITWIKKDGTVLYDTSASAKKMENHRDRPEVIEALKTGFGEDVRYSETLAERTMYTAVRNGDGTIIRVAQTQFSMLSLLASMLHLILIVLLLAVVSSLYLASRISKRIVKPINDIDVEHPLASEVYEEIQPLVERINEQNLELNAKIAELRVDVDEKTREADFRREFTANVSHELKTPLTSISGFAEIIKNGIVKEEDISPFAGKIYDEAQRLIVLVGDIIKLSQLDEKQIPAKKEKIDLLTTCEDVLSTLEIPAKAKNVTLETKGKHLYVEAVQQILEEIIFNLCDNGIKYNRDGGRLTAEVHFVDEHPAVTISDTGIGIPAEELDRVFERFYRVNKSHSKEIGGTGLGLSIVKHAVAYHNGDVRISSKVGEGTQITVLFEA